MVITIIIYFLSTVYIISLDAIVKFSSECSATNFLWERWVAVRKVCLSTMVVSTLTRKVENSYIHTYKDHNEVSYLNAHMYFYFSMLF